MIKTAIIGASGYIGSHLLRKYREAFPDCIGTGFSRLGSDLIPFDLREPDLASLKLQDAGHEAVIITSALPNVAWCEAHPKESYALNVQGTLKLVKLLAKTGIKLYFMSSDYVFNGKTGSYTDQADTSPVMEYGRQKAEVEREIPNLTDNYAILRLSKIYGTNWQDKTLIDDLASSMLKGQKLILAADQFFSPTHVEDVVALTLYAQEQGAKGVLNLCHPQPYSRFQIAQKLAAALGVSTSLCQSTNLHAIKGMQNRPLNTSLICSPLFEKRQPYLWTMDMAIERVASNWNQS